MKEISLIIPRVREQSRKGLSGKIMVNQCANKSCGKPLHYLREGRIFVFDVPVSDAPVTAGVRTHLQHFWLCGSCSESLVMEQTSSKEIRVVGRKNKVGLNPAAGMLPDSLAS